MKKAFTAVQETRVLLSLLEAGNTVLVLQFLMKEIKKLASKWLNFSPLASLQSYTGDCFEGEHMLILLSGRYNDRDLSY